LHSASPAPASPGTVGIEVCDCITGLGDAEQTVTRLLQGEVALKKSPVLGPDGGDEVPLSLRGEFTHTERPRWWGDLVEFLAPLQGGPWGDAMHPVFFASSNYGIDGLYSLGRQRDKHFAEFATPHGCVDALLDELGWGSHCFLLSHACVSGQLALERGAHFVNSGLAAKALIVTFDYVGPFVAAGFHSLKILNDGFPMPYHNSDVGSIGLGDGAAYCVLSSDPSPFQTGRQNTFNEMFHFTANEPEGSGFQKILEPYRELTGNHRFWVKGHGTGTLEAGKLEASNVQSHFPSAPLVSWKGSLGHTLGSCAAVELAIAVEAIRQGRIPGSIGSKPPFFAENVSADSFDAADFDSVLLLSNAFGGAHAAMLLHYA